MALLRAFPSGRAPPRVSWLLRGATITAAFASALSATSTSGGAAAGSIQMDGVASSGETTAAAAVTIMESLSLTAWGSAAAASPLPRGGGATCVLSAIGGRFSTSLSVAANDGAVVLRMAGRNSVVVMMGAEVTAGSALAAGQRGRVAAGSIVVYGTVSGNQNSRGGGVAVMEGWAPVWPLDGGDASEAGRTSVHAAARVSILVAHGATCKATISGVALLASAASIVVASHATDGVSVTGSNRTNTTVSMAVVNGSTASCSSTGGSCLSATSTSMCFTPSHFFLVLVVAAWWPSACAAAAYTTLEVSCSDMFAGRNGSSTTYNATYDEATQQQQQVLAIDVALLAAAAAAGLRATSSSCAAAS
jgi:hypothetical protein